jgi:hypothetical protein
MKPSSCKQKGRIHQHQVAQDIRDTFQLPEMDVISLSMGSQGQDILLSLRAREAFPFAVEAKNCETAKPWEWVKQAEANRGELTPIVVFRRNRSEPQVLISWKDFLKVVK